jgi:hypothetical protein
MTFRSEPPMDTIQAVETYQRIFGAIHNLRSGTPDFFRWETDRRTLEGLIANLSWTSHEAAGMARVVDNAMVSPGVLLGREDFTLCGIKGRVIPEAKHPTLRLVFDATQTQATEADPNSR